MQPTRTPPNTELGFVSLAAKLVCGRTAWVASAAAPPRIVRRVRRGAGVFRVILDPSKRVARGIAMSIVQCRLYGEKLVRVIRAGRRLGQLVRVPSQPCFASTQNTATQPRQR